MGGTHNIHIKKLQQIQNNAARYVLNGGIRWKTDRLMEACNWLGIRELIMYHSLITLWKLTNYGKPTHLAAKFKWTNDEVKTDTCRLLTTSSYFRWRTVRQWTEMKEELKQIRKMSVFKNELKKWLITRRKSEDMDPSHIPPPPPHPHPPSPSGGAVYKPRIKLCLVIFKQDFKLVI